MSDKPKRGRPPVDPSGTKDVNVRLPIRQYERLREDARRNDSDISTEIRNAIERRQRSDRP